MRFACAICKDIYFDEKVVKLSSSVDAILAAHDSHMATHGWLRKKVHKLLTAPKRWRVRRATRGRP